MIRRPTWDMLGQMVVYECDGVIDGQRCPKKTGAMLPAQGPPHGWTVNTTTGDCWCAECAARAEDEARIAADENAAREVQGG